MCCSNLSQHRHWKKKCKLHAPMHVAWFSDTDPVSGVKLDLRSGTSYSRSTTSNNKSCTSQLRSGTFLLGSTTLLGRIQASNTILSHKSQTECVECSKTPGRWQSLKNVPRGTDVLGKWKSVPGKIRIRASIFTSLFMLFYINIPFKLIVSDALRIAIKHECIFKNINTAKIIS